MTSNKKDIRTNKRRPKNTKASQFKQKRKASVKKPVFQQPRKFKKRPEEDYVARKDSYTGKAFEELNLSSAMLKALDKKGYSHSSSVQSLVIPHMLEYKDVIAKAPTGTGKTFAFGIPILEQLNFKQKEPQALILAPTRELVIQITDEMMMLQEFMSGVKIEAIYGGKPIDKQITALSKKPQIIVATPGRLIDHINRNTIDLSKVRTCVLDEADRMLDMGFIEEVSGILKLLKGRKNLALLSATMSIAVMDISWLYQRDPVEIMIEEEDLDKPDINQYSILVPNLSSKMKAVASLMDNNPIYKVLVFCNTINMVKRLTEYLIQAGYSASSIYGAKAQTGRERAIRFFRNEQLNILIATDVAARGLDINDVDAVINFDLPDDKEQYVHRIGRTGRALKTGMAINLMSAFDFDKFKEIIKYGKYDPKDIKEIPYDGILKIEEGE